MAGRKEERSSVKAQVTTLQDKIEGTGSFLWTVTVELAEEKKWPPAQAVKAIFSEHCPGSA